jgi:hypothetical protein
MEPAPTCRSGRDTFFATRERGSTNRVSSRRRSKGARSCRSRGGSAAIPCGEEYRPCRGTSAWCPSSSVGDTVPGTEGVRTSGPDCFLLRRVAQAPIRGLALLVSVLFLLVDPSTRDSLTWENADWRATRGRSVPATTDCDSIEKRLRHVSTGRAYSGPPASKRGRVRAARSFGAVTSFPPIHAYPLYGKARAKRAIRRSEG